MERGKGRTAYFFDDAGEHCGLERLIAPRWVDFKDAFTVRSDV